MPIRAGVSAGTTPEYARGQSISQAFGRGLLEGATSVGLQMATQALNLDPLAGALITRTLSGAISGALSPSHNVFKGVADSFQQSTGNLFASIPPPPDPEDPRFIQNGFWDRSAYNQAVAQYEAGRPVWMAQAMAKTNDLSDEIRNVGLGQALENYAASIFHRDSVESIVTSFGSVAEAFKRQLEANKARQITLSDGTLATELPLTPDNLVKVRYREDEFGQVQQLIGVAEKDLDRSIQEVRTDRTTRTAGMTKGANERIYMDGATVTARVRQEIDGADIKSIALEDSKGNKFTIAPNNFRDIRLNADGSIRDGALLDLRTGAEFKFTNGFVVEGHSQQRLDLSSLSPDAIVIPELGVKASDLQGLEVERTHPKTGQTDVRFVEKETQGSTTWNQLILKNIPGLPVGTTLTAALNDPTLRQAVRARTEQFTNFFTGHGWKTNEELAASKEMYLKSILTLAVQGPVDGLVIAFSDASPVGLAVKDGELATDRRELSGAMELLTSPLTAITGGIANRVMNGKSLELYHHIGFIKEIETADGQRKLYVLETNPDGLGRARLTPLEQKLDAVRDVKVIKVKEYEKAADATNILTQSYFKPEAINNATTGQVIWSKPGSPTYDWTQIAGFPQDSDSNRHICTSLLCHGFELLKEKSNSFTYPVGFPNDTLTRVSPQEMVDSSKKWGDDIAELLGWR
jgi:hypothetical protein